MFNMMMECLKDNPSMGIPFDPIVARTSLEAWRSNNHQAVETLREREKDGVARATFFYNAIRNIFTENEVVPSVQRGVDFTCYFVERQCLNMSRTLPSFGSDASGTAILCVGALIRGAGYKPGIRIPLEVGLSMAEQLIDDYASFDGDQFELDDIFWEAVREVGSEENEEMLPYFIAGAQLAAYGIAMAIQEASDFNEEMKVWMVE
jgi:hypothetical protein